MAIELIIAIAIIVVANIVIGCIFLHIKNKKIDQGVEELEPEPEQKPQDTEPMNGDPAVLTPTESGSSTESESDNPPFFFEEGEWYECIAPYEDFVVGDKYQCTEHGRLDGYLIKKPNDYFKPCEAPCEAPEPSEEDDEDDSIRMEAIFQGLIEFFSDIVDVDPVVTAITYETLYSSFTHLYDILTANNKDTILIYSSYTFPSILDVEGEKENPLVIEEAGAMLFYCILGELVPQKRQQLAEAALSYGEPIKDQEIYGWSFYSDPNVARKVVLDMYPLLRLSKMRSKDRINIMRHELGSEAISYKNDISELFLDFSKIMPPAAGPYLDAYSNRPNGIPAGRHSQSGNLIEDCATENFVANNYKLDSEDKEMRQATIQAIANKDHHLEHLFGKDRKVKDKKYGTMVFYPVFGKQTIGVEISDKGAIAALANAVGMPCSNNRKSLLNVEYGRCRPGQGGYDPSATMLSDYRALVNYAIEDGDGHTTGYYDQNGDYVDNNGTHIGDYETYFQGQLYANSYPSGHSAYIQGIGMALIAAMPEKAQEIIIALEEFRLSRVITRYHYLSDTIIGQLCGGMMMPVLFACTNIDLDSLIEAARKEYETLNP